MNFNTLHFAFFFALVLALVGFTRRRVRARNVLLLAASYYFYGCWDYRFLALIVVSTMVDYACGRVLDVRDINPKQPLIRTPRHRAALATSIACNLGILGFFKYFDFFVTGAADLASAMGFSADHRTLGIIVPVGISFYTFQTLGYTIDCYRGRVRTERSLLNFAVFVAFFPQLVAGPIERAGNLLPQFQAPSDINWKKLYSGFYLICCGLFKKVVIADQIAAVANAVFDAQQPNGVEVIIGVYAFAIQIYCDFSGYSDIARGAARCMGFDLMVNFNLPYFATSPSDFWRRWHISLSTWFRDYLYIPLGGSRNGAGPTCLNLLITMTLCGLWHGAAWTFVAFGLYHGILLALHRSVRPWLERHVRPATRMGKRFWFLLRITFCFHLVCLGWLLFRAESLTQASQMLWATATQITPWLGVVEITHVVILAACFLVLLGVQTVQWRSRDMDVIFRLPVPARAVVYATLFLGFIWFGRFEGERFIYFQF